MKTILFFIMVNIISCLTAQELKPNNHYNLAQKDRKSTRLNSSH